MPKEEKEKKKFKAVTEEVGFSSQNSDSILADVKVDSPEEKTDFVVQETKNIDTSSKVVEKRVFLKIFLVTFFATLLAFLLAGGIYVYLTGTRALDLSRNDASQATPLPQVTQKPQPTPSPSVSADLTAFKISVLNGNGGIGVATAAKQVIEKAGFKVVSVGNADSFDFTDTLVQAKASVSADVVAKLRDALSAKYSVKIGDVLDAADNYDIVVTVGSK